MNKINRKIRKRLSIMRYALSGIEMTPGRLGHLEAREDRTPHFLESRDVDSFILSVHVQAQLPTAVNLDSS